VIDPLPTWIVGGLAQVLGPTAAWNVWIAAGIVLAAVGGAALARVTRGVPEVGAVGLASAPILLGSLTSGLTEDAALGLVALALAAQWERRGWLAGVLLGLSAFCGLYVAWLGGLAAASLGLWQLWQARHARAAVIAAGRPLAAAAAIALVAAAVAARPFRDRLGGSAHRTAVRSTAPAVESHWRANPWRGADVATFLAPGDPDVGAALLREHPVYLGYATLALAVTVPSPAWLGVMACVAVAPGEQPAWMGTPLGVSNPAITVFRWLPFADRFNHHARVMLLGQLVLVILAARGAARSARLATVAPLALALEAVLLAPSRVPLPAAPADSPSIYAALTVLPDGPLSVSGAAGPDVNPQKVFYDQRAHGRRLLHAPDRPSDGRPTPGAVFVALGGPGAPRVRAAVAVLGNPVVSTADGAAWWIEATR
jgi:hypothetical protein